MKQFQILFGFAVLVAGCQLVNTNFAPLVSIYSGAVPVSYGLAQEGSVAEVSVDQSREGVILSASLDEVLLPSGWARLSLSGSDYYFANRLVDLSGAEADDWVLAGSTYYAKTIRLGADSDTKTFTGAVADGGVVYTHTDGGDTVTLPDSALGAAFQKWYYEQMTAGRYAVLTGGGAELTGVDYARNAENGLAYTGATKANRWRKAFYDSAWKSGRDALLAFFVGKDLIGAENLNVEARSGRWFAGYEDTQVDAAWNFETYLQLLVKAYKSAGTQVDATTSASE